MADQAVQEKKSDPVVDWRALALTRAGVSYDEALRLARASNPYLLEELARLEGCPPDLIVRILGD